MTEKHTPGPDEPDYDEYYDRDWDEDEQLECIHCGGDGWVENVAAESGKYGWDTEGPGRCPCCGGSGKREDQTYW